MSFQYRETAPWATDNYEVAWVQHRLRDFLPPALPEAPFGLAIASTETSHAITGPNFAFVFSQETGHLISWRSDGVSFLDVDAATASALTLGFWRPPTDNDVPYDLGEWRRFGLDTLTSQLRSMVVSHTQPSKVEVTSKTYISAPILAWGFFATTSYTISGDGALTVAAHITPHGPIPQSIPRIGWDLRLKDEFDNIRWFGLGPGEAYPDKKSSQRVGVYQSNTGDLHTPYEVPQEGGNRMETRWLQATDERGCGLRVIRLEETNDDRSTVFHWAASRYSAEAIEKARHLNELRSEKSVHIRLDIETAGVGTGACGPRTLEQYQVKCEERRFCFRLSPCRE